MSPRALRIGNGSWPRGLRRHGLALAPVLVLVLCAIPAHARVFMTLAEALHQAFPSAAVERRSTTLSPAQVQAVQRLARVRLTSPAVVRYEAWTGDSLTGTAFFDQRIVRTMPAVLMVVVRPDLTVGRVDILSFNEPPDFQPSARWLGQFSGRPLDDRLWPQRDIRMLSGATLSSRAVTESVRLALALARLLPPQRPAAR